RGGAVAVGRRVAASHRVAAIAARRFTHAELWAALDPLVARPAFRVAEVGRSMHGRPIRAVTYGAGPTTVLLWSQMHGDESTATMALADLLAWLGDPSDVDRALRARLAAELTVVMVPMLNPDGAEYFQRENAAGVDVNRDAARLATPEARTLKALRDSLRPAFGFNLHDQGARILTGRSGRQVGIALLAPAADERRAYEGARVAARLVAAGLARVTEAEIPGRVAKYEDDFNPRAFGDLMQRWGTSTVLIESGALPDDPEKQRLRAINVVALVSALDAIGSGRYRAADPRAYDALPMNDRAAVDVLVRGAHVVFPGGGAPMRLDLALNFDEPLARRRPRLREVGDLETAVAIDTVEGAGLFVHLAPSMLETDRAGARRLRPGAPAAFTLRRGPAPGSEPVRLPPFLTPDPQ
ncbi:M14 family zinc carboxypeptidase, partial [Roseisolibacter sp. H3M3-2]|uniref:M14 family zinc carboxypeptidase n=1 Tax=Roseisolibacter sp. H3M3-2 TaxID=3031323 RepID=UPI0023D9C058